MPLTSGSPMSPVRLPLVSEDAHSSCKLGGGKRPLSLIF
jgi:hypothetical protein